MTGGGVPHYADGRWYEGTAWPDAILDQHGPDWEKAIRQAGYVETTRFGRDYSFAVILFEHLGGRPDWLPPFLMELDTADGLHLMSVGTLADRMDLLARWAPAATASLLSSALNLTFGNTDGGLPDVRATEDQIVKAAGIRRDRATRDA